jgi:hypothetical protein
VLGAVEPAERRLIDQHLAYCARCRSELAGLAGMPALLAKVSADEAGGVVAADALTNPGQSWPSDQMLRSQLATAARVRRNRLRTWISVAAVAGAVAGSAAIAVWHVRLPSVRQPLAHQAPTPAPTTTDPDPDRPGYVTTARVTNPRTRVSATLGYSPRPWGLLLRVRVSGVAVGTPCRLEVIDALGHVTTAGSWTTDEGRGTWYPGSSSLSLDDVSGFIVASGAKTLVVIPLREHGPRGGGGPGRARLVPHGRRSAPAFHVIRPPPPQPSQDPGSAQLISHGPSAGRTGPSGNATDLAMLDFLRTT